MAPKGFLHILILENCDYIASQGKKEFAVMIKVRIWREGDYPKDGETTLDYMGGALTSPVTRVLIRGRQDGILVDVTKDREKWEDARKGSSAKSRGGF